MKYMSELRELLQLAKNHTNHQIGGWFVSDKLDGMRAYWDGGTTRGMLAADVPAGAVVIPIPITLVYDENTGTPSEWNTSTNYPTGIDFNATNIFIMELNQLD